MDQNSQRCLRRCPDWLGAVGRRCLDRNICGYSVGGDMFLTLPTVLATLNQTLIALTAPQKMWRFIHFSTKQHEVKQQQAAGVGVIDGTHVKIIPPTLMSLWM